MNRLLKNIVYHAPWLLSDRKFIECFWELKMGTKLDLDNPKSFNEKLQWLKLNDHQPEYTKMADKAAVKDYVAGIIGAEHIIPTLGVYDKVSDIPWDSLPGQFVLKCTHDSGGVVICPDKNSLDIASASRKLESAISHDYFRNGREWVYKGIKPRIICEEYIGTPNDYKWFCFDGKPELMFIASERGSAGTETRFDFYDMEFNHLPFTNGHPNADTAPQKPSRWDEMKKLAAELSKGFRHIRVDLYEVGGRIYFGELTFYHFGGFVPFFPSEWDLKIGDYLTL